MDMAALSQLVSIAEFTADEALGLGYDFVLCILTGAKLRSG
jgi:hypothetical protein